MDADSDAVNSVPSFFALGGKRPARRHSAPAAPAAGAESRAPAGRAGAATLLKFSLRHLIFVQSIRKKKRERIFQL